MTELDNVLIQQTLQWVKTFVIELNLCPFAKREIDRGTVKIHVSHATTDEQALIDMMSEVKCLDHDVSIETTLLLFPDFLDDFFDYLDVVDAANDKLSEEGYEGVYQLATFHPKYCFAGEDRHDVSHYTNRSPYPMLHLLREEQLEKAIAFYGDTAHIPEHNMRLLRHLGLQDVKDRLAKCISPDS